jgi:hypothetical protein
MFRVVLPPIIRNAYNCIYSIWYLSHRFCYLPLSWKSWNRFECRILRPEFELGPFGYEAGVLVRWTAASDSNLGLL